MLAAWTPGSYLLREYSRHLSGIAVADAASGTLLPWRKSRKNRYRVELVEGGPEQLQILYTVYAHELTVRTSDLTASHALWNGACVFLWPVVGGQPAEMTATIQVRLPTGWELHSQLARARGPDADQADGQPILEASSLDELIDSPCLAASASQLLVQDFEALGRPHRFVHDGLAGIEPHTDLIEHTGKIIEQAARVFCDDTEDEPQLPYESYQFLVLYADKGRGGLEHRGSSVLLAPRTTFCDRHDYEDFMGLVAHEHFHVWNVKRMRPKDLWVYDYENETYTDLLWVAEGFTAYYDDHLCRRAGVLTPRRYLEVVAKNISDMRRTPGRLDQPLASASYDAWIRLYRPNENTRNVTQSYYGNGALVAMLIDLKIREITNGNASLDTAMRLLYRRTYMEGRGYGEDDVVACLTEAAGEAGRAHDFAAMVSELVRGPLDPDFCAAFAPFGLEIKEKAKDTPFLGVAFKAAATTVASVALGGPADAAGLSPGDEILALNDLRTTPGGWSSVFDAVAKVDQPLEVLLSRRGVVQTLSVTPAAQPPADLKLEVSQDSTPDQDRLRRGWLFEQDPA